LGVEKKSGKMREIDELLHERTKADYTEKLLKVPVLRSFNDEFEHKTSVASCLKATFSAESKAKV